MKELADSLRNLEPKTVFLLHSTSHTEKKIGWNIVAASTKKYTEECKFNLGKITSEVLSQMGEIKGGGGGRNEMGQASAQIKSGNAQMMLFASLILSFKQSV